MTTPYVPGPEPIPMPEGGLGPREEQNYPFPLMQYPEPQPSKSRRNLWIVLGTVVAATLCCAGAVVFGASETKNRDAVRFPIAVSPSSAVPSTKATTKAPVATSVKPTATIYSKISDRTWKRIAKNPDAYSGKSYVVYGSVTQFDSATGNTAMLANVAGTNKSDTFYYDSNTMLGGSKLASADIVEGDEFKAKVTVIGSHSYDTQIGGNTTVPMLKVDSIKRIG